MDRMQRIWGSRRPVVGVLHLPPLPGSPGWEGSMAAVLDRALSDADALEEGGVEGILVENFGDAPFHPRRVPPETVAAMARVASEVASSTSLPVGINVLRNDAHAALAVATAAEAAFIRVNVHTGVVFTDQGTIQGAAHRTLRLRRALGSDVAILADVFVKHGTPPPGLALEDAAEETRRRGLADALVLTGRATGAPTDPEEVRRVRERLPDTPVWVGSGVTPERVQKTLAVAHGIIVGSWIREGGRAGGRVDPTRVRTLMEAVARLRGSG